MNLHSRICALVLLLTCVAAAPLPAQTPPPSTPATASATTPTGVDPAQEAEIRKLLQLTGAVRMVEQMKQQMFTIFRKQASQLPPEFWTRLDKDTDTDQLITKLIPVYDKYYSLDDLKAVNAFYQSPPGQRLLQAQPQVLHDSMTISQEWGRQAGMKVALEMQDYKQSAPPADSAPASGASAPPTP
jgi:hypothetical protein